MRNILATALLVLAVGCPTFAGEMHTPVATQPPPPPQNVVQEQPAGGDMPCPPMVEFALMLLALL